MRLKTSIAALSAASLMALAACGGDDGGGGEGPGNEVDKETLAGGGQAQDPDREGPVEVEGATEGGTVKVLSYAGLNTMDVSEAYYQNTLSILSGLVTRSLTQYVYDPDSGETTLVPDLATDLGTPNEDFTEWSFTLRDGIKWEDGSDVTVDDLVFGIKRSMDRESFPEGATYSNDYFEGGDKYGGPYTDPKGEFNGITTDGNTITIKMSTPFPDMPYWGSFPAMGPVKEGADSAPDRYRLHPLATGPYKFGDYTPEKALTLVRNENWDPATDPGRTAYPDEYVFDFQTESAKIDQILLADQGEGQTTMTYDNVLNENYRRFSSEASDRLVTGGQPLTTYWAFDTRKIKDMKVRQAIAWAYPYEDALLAAGYIKDVTRILGTELLPPGLPGRAEYEANPGQAAGQTDTKKARELLQEAGAEGFEVRWLFATDDPKSVAAKDVVAASLKEAGFTPKPVATTVAELSTVRNDPDAPINVRPAGWLSDWPSGGSWLPPLMNCQDFAKLGVGQNYSLMCDKEVDQQIADTLSLPIEEQTDAWGELDKKIMTEKFPLFVLGYGGVAMAHGSKINGMYDDPAAGMPTWKSIWVTQ